MVGAFCNIRIVNDADKRHKFCDAVNDNRLHFIGLSETKKNNLPLSWLDNMTGSRNFTWHVVPSKGILGRMALWVNVDVYDVIEVEGGECYIRIPVNLALCEIVSIYGAQHAKDRDIFLIELVHIITPHIAAGIPVKLYYVIENCNEVVYRNMTYLFYSTLNYCAINNENGKMDNCRGKNNR
jgi:hypothetical protein